MPKPKQIPSFPFVGGRETKIDPVIVGREQALDLVNYTLAVKGTPTRRDAWVALAGTDVLSNADGQAELIPYQAELLIIDSSENVKTYTPSAIAKVASAGFSGSQAVTHGRVPFTAVRRDQIRRANDIQAYPDQAFRTNVSCFVWQGQLAGAVTGLYATFYDEETGAIIAGNIQFDATTTVTSVPRVCGALTGGLDRFLMVWTDGIDIKCISYDRDGAPVTGTSILASDVFGVGRLEVSAIGTGEVLICYESSTGTTTVAALTVDGDGVPTSVPITAVTTAQVARGTITGIGLAPYSTANVGLLLSRNAGNIVTTAIINLAASVLTVPFAAANTAVANNMTSITGTLVGASLRVFATPLATGGALLQNATFTLSAANVASGVTSFQGQINVASGMRGPQISGKAFTWGTLGCVPVCMFSSATYPLQDSMFVLAIDGTATTAELIAAAMYGVFNPTSSLLNGYLASSTTLANGIYSLPAVEKGRLSISSGVVTTSLGLSRVQLSFGRSATRNAVEYPLWHALAGECAYLSGGWVAQYDGARSAEAGFHYFPEGVAATAGAAGNPNGALQYVALYEWVDNQGQRHQSAPSIPVSITVTNDQVALTAPTLQLGVRRSTTLVVFYRTTDAGTTFYRVGSVANNTAANTVGITDNLLDATLIGNEILYTAGALPNTSPVNARAICNHQGRLFLSSENPREVRYSQLPVRGVGLQFNEVLAFEIPLGFGDITALESLDDRLVIFTPSAKFAVFGQGPDALGVGATYSAPAWLSGTTGCIDQRSKAIGPRGLSYQSSRGYYLLNRSLQEEYSDFGASIEGDLLSFAGIRVTSAVYLENLAQLRLTVPQLEAVLVYDYEYRQWSKFKATNVDLITQTGCIFAGLWTAIDAIGDQVIQDSPGTYLDLGTGVIVGTRRSAWFKLDAIGGWARFNRMVLQAAYAASGASSSLAITADINNILGSSQSQTVTFASTLALANAGQLPPLRFKLATQKAQSVVFTIVDTPVAAAAGGAGLNLSALTLEATSMQQANKLPAAQSR